jgi:hypothetical protein
VRRTTCEGGSCGGRGAFATIGGFPLAPEQGCTDRLTLAIEGGLVVRLPGNASGCWRKLELSLNTFNYSVNDFIEWACGIDDRARGGTFFGGMKTKYQFLFLFIPAPVIGSTTSQSLLEGLGIHVQHDYFVEDVQEFIEVPGTARAPSVRFPVSGSP